MLPGTKLYGIPWCIWSISFKSLFFNTFNNANQFRCNVRAEFILIKYSYKKTNNLHFIQNNDTVVAFLLACVSA